jgi:hypothetical protein
MFWRHLQDKEIRLLCKARKRKREWQMGRNSERRTALKKKREN